jgi:hypothetical protein
MFGATSPFNFGGIKDDIDRAIATLRPEERFAVTLHVEPAAGFSGGLVVRGPGFAGFTTEGIATVTKPLAGRLGFGASLRISRLVPETPQPARFMPLERGLYAVLRLYGNAPLQAWRKARTAARGFPVSPWPLHD